MTSKEALEILNIAWSGRKDKDDYPNFDDINEALYTIKQDLEKLEKLEQAKKLIFVLLEQVPLKKLHNRGLHITTKDGKSIPFLEYINKNLKEIWEIKIELYDK